MFCFVLASIRASCVQVEALQTFNSMSSLLRQHLKVPLKAPLRFLFALVFHSRVPLCSMYACCCSGLRTRVEWLRRAILRAFSRISSGTQRGHAFRQQLLLCMLITLRSHLGHAFPYVSGLNCLCGLIVSSGKVGDRRFN